MKKKKNWIRAAGRVMVILGVILMLPAFVAAEQSRPDKTLDNLQAAYNGESNANAKYLAYAVKADEEGYQKVAGLFRAAAIAEAVHLKNHADVIKKMGATPIADIKLPAVKSTRENLEDAIKGETYEQTTMYPGFISEAEKENNAAAVQTFTYARSAEAEHAKLYKKALDNLGKWKKADVNFYVCPICGYTVDASPTFANCPLCGTPTKDYLIVS